MTLRNPTGPLASEDTLDDLRDLFVGMMTPSGAQLVGNARTKFRDGFAGTDVAQPSAEVWTVENDLPWAADMPDGHIVAQGGNAFGASYLRVSLSPFVDDSQVRITSKDKFRFPTRVAFGITQSQRILGQDCFFGLVEADDTDPLGIRRTVDLGADRPITGGGTVTSNVLALTVPGHGFASGDRVILIGCPDTRMNVGPVVVTVTGLDSITVPVTIGNATYTVTGGFVRHADPASRADNAVGLLLENATVTNATFVARRNKAKYRLRNSTIGSTANAQGTTAAWADAFIAGAVHELQCSLDEVSYRSWSADANSGMSGVDKFTQGIPDEEVDYRLHVRMRNLDYMSRPIARIVSITKAGSTTATVTTDRPHGLTVTSRVGVIGVRDQTNFANTTDLPVASVPSATTFTVAFGASATATDALGGVVYINHGLVLTPGAFTGQAVSTFARDANGMVTVVANSTWASPVAGEYVHLWGLNGAGMAAHEGAYKVLGQSGTSLFLEPHTGRVTGNPIVATNTGGALIRRTDVRLHFVRVLDHTRILTEVIGGRGNNSDGNNGVPVTIASAPTLTMTPGSLIPYAAETLESATNLAASGLYTGATRDMGTDRARPSSRIRVAIRHLAGLTPGVAYMEQSQDGTNWFESWRQPIPSDGILHTFEVPLQCRYYRWRFQNGATAQTGFLLQTLRVAMEGPTDLAKVLTFPLSTTALAAAGVFTGPTLDLGGNHGWEEFRAMAFADQAGTLFIDQSRDGTTWRTIGAGAAVAAGGAAELSQKVHQRYVRARYVNGATLQGAFSLDASLATR